MADLSGQRLGQYQITGLLGKGGMATVYRARQLTVDRDVAIKVIETNLTANPEFTIRFEREAKTIASLNHPFILKLFDFGSKDNLLYLVMELHTGGSLADRLRERGPLEPEEVLRYIEQISKALDYAHARNIIHRDLKPQNILLDSEGNAILTDFGIARISTDATRLTGTSMAMGTPAYMAPEQWLGAEVGFQADLYALAMMAYELLTGALPYTGNTPPALMYQHLHEMPVPLRQKRPELPQSLEQVILRGIAKHPEDRFQSATAFAEAFREALSGKTPAGVRLSRTQRPLVKSSGIQSPLRPPSRRHWHSLPNGSG
jgi:serine/threonine protein kinase